MPFGSNAVFLGSSGTVSAGRRAAISSAAFTPFLTSAALSTVLVGFVTGLFCGVVFLGLPAFCGISFILLGSTTGRLLTV